MRVVEAFKSTLEDAQQEMDSFKEKSMEKSAINISHVNA